MKGGTDGLTNPYCCVEFLISIDGMLAGWFSILTDTSLDEFLLIRVVAHVKIIIEMIEAPTPINGHLMVSNNELGGDSVVIIWSTSDLINSVEFSFIFFFSKLNFVLRFSSYSGISAVLWSFPISV